MSAENTKEWNKANQRYLMAALKVVQQELEAYQTRLDKKENDESTQLACLHAQEELEKAAMDIPAPAALESLVTTLGLSTFERKILLMCAGIELDNNFSTSIAALQEGSSLFYPSFSMALAAFADAHWSAVAPGSPLRYWHLIELNNGELLTKGSLKIDEHILHYITGVRHLDERLEEIIDPVFADKVIVPSQVELANAISLAYVEKGNNGGLPVLQLSGDDGADKSAVVAYACAKMGVSLYSLSVNAVPGNAKDVRELSRLWNREAALNSFGLFLDCTKLDVNDKPRVQSMTGFIEKTGGILILDTGQWEPGLKRTKVKFHVSKPSAEEQLVLWKNNLGENANDLDKKLEKIVAHFNLGANTIKVASMNVLSGQSENKATENDATPGLEKKIWKECCIHTRPKVEQLAQRIEPVATWSDIVLPEAQKQVLREIAIQVKHRKKVYGEWGFACMGSRGLGISALFTGESGTGKTMASEVLAHELQLDLYRIDLSQVVNKYIGETEKNLKQIFDAAEEGGAILLFDEADALFGKRSDVKDSHDRYSNIEVSYLLQRMETYGGLAVLTTNMRSAIDKAFLRRIRFVVQFPYPDTVLRAEIWRRIFPPNTPVKDLDIDKLSRLSIPGGNIRNIAINAAFLAADEEQPVQMYHISRAVRGEYNKLEKALSNTEMGSW